jgi:hypothetical protein
MATFYDHITQEQATLIAGAQVFFVATAAPDFAEGADGAGPINLSPKGSHLPQVLSPTRIAYIDYSGSGNETARHIGLGSPITLMLCSFDADAAIVRLYGRAEIRPLDGAPEFAALLAAAPPEKDQPLKTRQIIDVHVTRTMTSCGYGVPLMHFSEDRAKTQRGRRFK